MDAQLTFEDIDPKLAQEYLALNIDHNRSPMNDRIERMARDMRNGDWIATADPIKFNAEGRLIDGQHRLRSVMASNTTQRFLVARDIAEDAVYVIDTGASRSAKQALRIANPDSRNNGDLVAIAQLVSAYDRGSLRNVNSVIQGRERMTNAEVIRYVEENREALEAAERMASWVKRAMPAPGSALGAAYFILARVDTAKASDFYARIREGNSGFTVSDPVTTLTRRVYQDKLNQRRITPALILFYIFRTWNAWRDEETLSKLQAGSASGAALIPQPK